MQIFKNKHLVLAMFVAPVLAIIAYFAVDSFLSEKPHQARQGESYKLAAKSNCRYQSGLCTLQNGDVQVSVRIERLSDSLIRMFLSSNMPVQNVLAEFVKESSESEPVSLYRDDLNENTWTASIEVTEPENSTMRLAMELSGTLFYAETPAVFIDYETTFSRENISE